MVRLAHIHIALGVVTYGWALVQNCEAVGGVLLLLGHWFYNRTDQTVL